MHTQSRFASFNVKVFSLNARNKLLVLKLKYNFRHKKKSQGENKHILLFYSEGFGLQATPKKLSSREHVLI